MALASAALAFFSRALQASRSRRRFWRSRLSFCRWGRGDGETLGRGGTGRWGHLVKTGELRPRPGRSPLQVAQSSVWGSPRCAGCPAWEESLAHGSEERAALLMGKQSGPRSLTEMVFQSPSRKLRRGVRKLMEAVWMKSRSAAPRRFSASATLIRVFPEKTELEVRRVGLRLLRAQE